MTQVALAKKATVTAIDTRLATLEAAVASGGGGGGGGVSTSGGGIPVYNVKDYGAVGDGVSNDYPAFLAALNALYASGKSGQIYVPAGNFLLNTLNGQLRLRPLTIPSGSTTPTFGGYVVITGAGVGATKILLTSNCSTFFSSSDATGIGTMHGNFVMEHMTIDRQGIATPAGHMLGAIFCLSNARTSVQNMYFRNLNSVGMGPLRQGGGETRNVDITIVSTQGSDADGPYTVTNIHGTDCDFKGGHYGFIIQAWAGGLTPSIAYQQDHHRQNVFFDEIYLRRCKHDTTHNTAAQTSLIGATNFMVGGYGYGGKLVLEDLYGANSGDDCIEIGAFKDITVNRCTGKDAWSSLFYLRNIGGYFPPEEQHVRFLNCRGINESRSSAGIYLHSTIGQRIGHIEISDYVFESFGANMKTSTLAIALSGALRVEADFASLTVNDMVWRAKDFNHVFTANNQSKASAAVGIAQLAHRAVVNVNNLRCEMSGTLEGGSFTGCSYGFRGVSIFTADAVANIKGVTLNNRCVQSGNGSYSWSEVVLGGADSPAPTDGLFVTDNIGTDYVCDTGNLTDVSVDTTAGVLKSVANHSAEKRFVWLHIARGNWQTIGPITDGAPLLGPVTYSRTAGFKSGPLLRNETDATSYVEGYITDDGTNSLLKLDQVLLGVRTNLANQTLGSRIADGALVYLRLIARQNTYTVDYFTAAIGGTVTNAGAATIAGVVTDKNRIGEFALKRPGFVWTPAVSTSTLDGMQIARMQVLTGHWSEFNVADAGSPFLSTFTGINFNADNRLMRIKYLVLDNMDFSPAGSVPTVTEFTSLIGGTLGHGPTVRRKNIKYVNAPSAVTGTAASSGTAYQNLEGQDLQVSYYGGTITKVEHSIDGGNTWTQISDGPTVFTLKTGESLKPTYTGTVTQVRVPVR